MMHWFHALLPREERFFELFVRHSDVVAAGAKALRDMLEGGDAVHRYCKTVMDREQDADNIIFIFRDDYYEAESDQRGIAELIVAKQRNGPTGRVKVRFESAYTRFDNLAPGEHDQSDGDD